MNRWDVWLANVPFEDIPSAKKLRPVLVMDDAVIVLSVFKMTTHPPRDELDYQLINYAAAGLPKQTVVRLSKLIILDSVDMIRQLGRLSLQDIQAIRKAISCMASKEQ